MGLNTCSSSITLHVRPSQPKSLGGDCKCKTSSPHCPLNQNPISLVVSNRPQLIIWIIIPTGLALKYEFQFRLFHLRMVFETKAIIANFGGNLLKLEHESQSLRIIRYQIKS